MPNTQPTEIEKLTRQVIREKLGALNAMDADITSRLAAMYGKPGSGIVQDERLDKTHDRARALLNGAGHILRKPGPNATESTLSGERAAVRMAIAALEREDLGAAAIEAATRAQQLGPQWRAICARWLKAALAFEGCEREAQAFLAAAGGEVRDLLDLAQHIGSGAEVDIGFAPSSCGVPVMCRLSIDELAAKAQKAGVVTGADVRRAQREGVA